MKRTARILLRKIKTTKTILGRYMLNDVADIPKQLNIYSTRIFLFALAVFTLLLV